MCTLPDRAPTRVLWLVHYPVFGGPHNRILRLYPALRRAGVEVVAMVPSEPGNAVQRLTEGGVPVIAAPIGRARATGDLRRQLRFFRHFGHDVGLIRGALRRTKADAMIVGGLINPQGPIAAHLEGTALVWQILDSRTPRALVHGLMPVVDRLADTVTFAGESLIELHPGAGRLRVPTMISTPGVDTERFRPAPDRRAATRRQLGIADDDLVVGSVANVNPQKGIEYFVRAAGEIRRQVGDVRFLIVGAYGNSHAEYHEQMKAEIETAGLSADQLIFAGEQSDIEQWIPAMDVKLMTSVPRSEGTPTVILESWACGVPVVATEVGAVDRMLADGVGGYLVPPCDPEMIATRTLALLSDRGLRERMGATGRALVEERYSTEHVAAVHIEAVRTALEHARLKRGA